MGLNNLKINLKKEKSNQLYQNLKLYINLKLQK